MTNKKLTVTISFDGTSNNKNSNNNRIGDVPTAKHTNVARLNELIVADQSFDFSRYANNGSTRYEDGVEGNLEAFSQFLDQDHVSAQDSTDSLKLYIDGVGSQEDQSSSGAKLEGGTGSGTDIRVKQMLDAVEMIRKTYGPDVEIDLNVIGFSRGSAAGKDFLNKLSEKYPDDPYIRLNKAVFFDTVAAMGNADDETHTNKDLGYPGIADGDSKVLELLAANEHRGSFSSTPYQDGRVKQEVVPGAHAQVGGGYFHDILAAGSLTRAMSHFSDDYDGSSSLSLKSLSIDDLVKLRLYNAVIENPYLVRALITDSRIITDDLVKPGVVEKGDGASLVNRPFPLEKFQDYEFDRFSGQRGVIDERQALSFFPHTKILNDIGVGIQKLFNSGRFYGDETSTFNILSKKIATSNESISSIANQAYQKVNVPANSDLLPLQLEAIVSTFESKLKLIQYDPERLDDPKQFQDVLDELKIISKDFAESLISMEVSPLSFGYDNKTSQLIDSMQENVNVLEKRIAYLEQHQQKEAEELKNQEDETIKEARSDALFDALGKFESLKLAIVSSGDSLLN